ncbi:MAG: HAMP domain-containing sensor histidine kinase [Pirellulales bacterium]
MLFSHWPIRRKLQLGLGLFAISVLTLFGSACYGLYAYRSLAKSLSVRSGELPLADKLRDQVAGLHEVLNQLHDRQTLDTAFDNSPAVAESEQLLWQHYHARLDLFCQALGHYREQLDSNRARTDLAISDDRYERETLRDIDGVIARIKKFDSGEAPDWLLDNREAVSQLASDVDRLRDLTNKLPSYLHDRFRQLASDVRNEYRFAIGLAWTTTVLTSVLLIAAVQLFRKWIARPLSTLVSGSRKVAAGQFDHRIRLESEDEMRELAESMNDMTARFQEIRDDLDCQVRERTKQVVRSEQLASVGFLAAGVAHEINNPLASIAMCSESLESRLSELLSHSSADQSSDRDIVLNYLDMIQKEAFRCKQITEKLLDFSRMGDPERQNTDFRELVAGVIEMIRHLGKYQNKHVVLRDGGPVIVEICPQEMKQVVLNLITNGLDSVEPGGAVTLSITRSDSEARLVVEDNGCGMSEEVLKHLFEPFFTRRRGGQGTGLGLSISYRIVEEHDGQIVPHSDGPGKGSKFTVTLPIRHPSSGKRARQRAA